METRVLIEQSILFAIDALTQDIKENKSKDKRKDAQAVMILAEAFDIVHRGKGGECRC